MGFSTDNSMVRVDFFKSGGKWYTTEAVKWTGNQATDPVMIGERLREFAMDQSALVSGLTAVCLEPYHEHAHPIMLAVDAIDAELAQR